MIFVTGDIHGDCTRLKYVLRRIQAARKDPQEPVHLLVAGDFGFLFAEPDRDLQQLKNFCRRLPSENTFVLFCDGNHENHEALARLPLKEAFGGPVHELCPNVLHLIRGGAYEIEGQSFFVFGGAASKDQDYRQLYLDTTGTRIWWPQELPDDADYHRGSDTLQQHQFHFDWILSHTAPAECVRMLGFAPRERELNGYLEWVAAETEFRQWFFGHFHTDQTVLNRFRCLYKDVVQLVPEKGKAVLLPE